MGSNKDLILSIDIGTSASKAFVFTPDGSIVFRAITPYSISIKHNGLREQNAEELCNSMMVAIGQVCTEIDPNRIVGVGVSSQLGFVCIGKDGKPTRPLITWMDKRAATQAQTVQELLGENVVFLASGKRIDPERMACQIMWIRENEPGVYEKTAYFTSINSYLVYCLTGEIALDPVQASYSLLYDLVKCQWREDFVSELRISGEKLPLVLPCHEIVGQVTQEVANCTGLLPGTPVVVGGPDGTVGILGTGVATSGKTVDVMGTTDVVFTCLEKPVFDASRSLILNSHVVPGLWLIGGPTTTTGGCVQWYVECWKPDARGSLPDDQARSSYDLFNECAAAVEPGSNGLIFIPTMVGDRAPAWDPNMRGAIVGLNMSHTRDHIMRSILEGTSYMVRRMLETIEELVRIDLKEVYVVGGGARSALLQQIRANVTGKRIMVPSVTEATALGTAILTGVGAGLFESFSIAESLVSLADEVEPHKDIHMHYDTLYSIYLDIYEQLAASFHALAEIKHPIIRS